MDLTKMTIKSIAQLLEAEPTEELLAACREDSRAAIGKLLLRYWRKQKERARVAELYHYERKAKEKGLKIVAGTDEAGRGPLAGPVVVAAVILPDELFLPKINDSKKLSPKIREELFEKIQAEAVSIGVSTVDEKTIDHVNIYQATIKGMHDAILSLRPQPDAVLIDAMPLKDLPMPSMHIVKGDAKSASIAAASIIAKVTRDRLMMEYDRQYPQYGFAQHKGYGTAAHIAAIRKYGPCPIHRLTFEPIKSMTEGLI